MPDLETPMLLNHRFIHNCVTNDVAAHDALLHPDFTCMAATGKRIDRAPYLAGWAAGSDPAIIAERDMRRGHEFLPCAHVNGEQIR